MGDRLAWREGVSIDEREGAVVIRGTAGRVTFRGAGQSVRELFRMLHPPGADEEKLAETLESSGAADLPRWLFYLDRLTRRSLINRSVCEDGKPVATLMALSPQFTARGLVAAPNAAYVLSRFAYLRREGNESVLESPLAHARIVFHDCRAVAIAAKLACPQTTEEMAAGVELSREGCKSLLRLMLTAGMVVEHVNNPEEDNPALRTWAFHDLLFHARSRKGRWDAPSGGTFRFVGVMPQPPALKPLPSGLAVTLPRPDLERLQQEDPPLAWVQEHRRSGREFNRNQFITLAQLSEFLFRVNRVNGSYQSEIPTNRGLVAMDFVTRGFPAGGALYELEFYLAVNACDGLPPGLYYHDPVEHRLIRMRARTPALDSLLSDAAESTGAPADSLQVLIVLAARVPRLAWKYESIAYSLVLKHVGVVFQTMYLAATAMGLAACAVGGGDADLFARAAGLEYAAETSVGEFLLGSRPMDPREPTW